MTSIGLEHRAHRDPRSNRESRSAIDTALLFAGLVASIAYVAVDVTSAFLYPNYSFLNQAVSELSAIGSPTAWLWSILGPTYNVLTIAFAIGVLRVAGERERLRAVGWLLVAFGLTDVLWAFVPMHPRGTQTDWRDVGHIVLTVLTVLLILSFISVGALTLGRRFRVFSFATLAALLIAAIVSFTYASRVASGRPTPGLGLIERVNVYGYLVWVATFAVALQRQRVSRASGVS